jgi:hypothetical protein
MSVQHNPQPVVRRRLGAAAMLLAAGSIALLAPAGAASADARDSVQDAYANCIHDEIARVGVHPSMDAILTSCCAQVGGTPSFTQDGKFVTCTLPTTSSPGDGSGNGPNPPRPGSVVIGHQLPDATHV